MMMKKKRAPSKIQKKLDKTEFIESGSEGLNKTKKKKIINNSEFSIDLDKHLSENFFDTDAEPLILNPRKTSEELKSSIKLPIPKNTSSSCLLL